MDPQGVMPRFVDQLREDFQKVEESFGWELREQREARQFPLKSAPL